jgi:hypothetical protein
MPPGADSTNSSTGQTGTPSFGGQTPPGTASSNSSTGGSTGTNNTSGSNAATVKQDGVGGPDENATPGKNIVKLIQQNASKFTWVAATVGSQSSAPYQLATGEPIMDIGGFTGSDPSPTLAQFKKYVSEGKIHYYISGGMNHGGPMASNTTNDSSENGSTNGETNGSSSGGNFQGGPMGGSNSEISTWVQNNFKSKTVDGVTVYDLTQPNSK